MCWDKEGVKICICSLLATFCMVWGIYPLRYGMTLGYDMKWIPELSMPRSQTIIKGTKFHVSFHRSTKFHVSFHRSFQITKYDSHFGHQLQKFPYSNFKEKQFTPGCVYNCKWEGKRTSKNVSTSQGHTEENMEKNLLVIDY